MSELKKFKTDTPIEISLSLLLANHGFKYQKTIDLGDLDGICDECKHQIRYENRFLDEKDNIEYVFGSECMFKIYIFSHWKDQITEDQIENKDLQRAGKWLWIISRDGYSKRINKIPEPVDFNYDFKTLADELKKLVIKIRYDIKKENEIQKQKELLKKERSKVVEWLNKHEINWKSCNDWEKDFLASIYSKKIQNGYALTEKQLSVLERIKSKRNVNNTQVDEKMTKEENNSNSEDVVSFLKDLSNKQKYMNEWEVEFIDSALNQAIYKELTKKQWDKINQIVEKITEEEKKDVFINKRVDSWIIEKNTGISFEVDGIITNVERETEKAILCSVMNPKTNESVFSIWVPKTTIK